MDERLHDFIHRFSTIGNNLDVNWEEFKKVFTEFVLYVEEKEKEITKTEGGNGNTYTETDG